MNDSVCREGAWTELTVRVTPVIAVQSETHGFNIIMIGHREAENCFTVSFTIPEYHF